MAVAYESSGIAGATSTNQVNITNITLTGSNRYLCGFGSGSGSAPNDMTFAGTDMWATLKSSAGSNYSYVAGCELVAPSTAANQTFTVDYAASTDELSAGYINYTGVDQTTPSGTAATPHHEGATASDTTPEITITSASGEICVSFVHASDNGPATTNSIAAYGGQTEREEILDVGNYTSSEISDEPGAASVTMGYTLTSVVFGCSLIGWPIKPAAGGATGKSNPLDGPLGGPLAGPIAGL